MLRLVVIHKCNICVFRAREKTITLRNQSSPKVAIVFFHSRLDSLFCCNIIFYLFQFFASPLDLIASLHCRFLLTLHHHKVSVIFLYIIFFFAPKFFLLFCICHPFLIFCCCTSTTLRQQFSTVWILNMKIKHTRIHIYIYIPHWSGIQPRDVCNS